MTILENEDYCLVFGKRPEGFRVIQNFVSAEEQEEIWNWIMSNFAWEKRRQGELPPAEQYPHNGPIPSWAEALGNRMVALSIFPSQPDHVRLTRYERGIGIYPHIDREAYGPIISGVTLGSSRKFNLTRPRRRSRLEAMLFPGDLYVMTGAARFHWKHSIPARLEDEFRGTIYKRTDGFSVTWRYSPDSLIQRSWWMRQLNNLKARYGF